MIRIEIIMDQTIEDILLEALRRQPGLNHFTHISPVNGNGAAGPRMGNHTWPEENSLFIIYTAEINAAPLAKIIKGIRKEHPHNGVAMFVTPSAREF